MHLHFRIYLSIPAGMNATTSVFIAETRRFRGIRGVPVIAIPTQLSNQSAVSIWYSASLRIYRWLCLRVHEKVCDMFSHLVTSCAGDRHNMPRPLQTDRCPFDLESGVRVACDVGYLCANFSLPRPLCSRLRPDVRDSQTSDAYHRFMPLPGAGA